MSGAKEHLEAIGAVADDLGFLVHSVEIDEITLISSTDPTTEVIVRSRYFLTAETIRKVLTKQQKVRAETAGEAG